MGCCQSLELPDIEDRLNTIVVKEDIQNDQNSTTQNSQNGDFVPLLEGPSPLNFANLKFSSDSNSDDVDMERIEQLLNQDSQEAQSKEKEDSQSE